MSSALVGDANPSDAGSIGGLLRTAFDARYLLMSVYSSPRGDRHLERCLRDGAHDADIRVRVVRSEQELLGCTIVSIRAGKYHLDYVATAPSAAGSGLGSRLLDDALEGARGELSLDVFESNRAVRAWYRRRGFLDGVERVVQVVDLGRVSPARTWDAETADSVERARKSELEQGFGEFTIRSGSAAYRFGLLGETSMRLLEFPNGGAPVAASIARAVVPDREHLALPIGQEHKALPTYFTDHLLRMEAHS